MANQWHFDPDSYLAMVRSEIPAYDELQAALAEATRGVAARRVLDLGSGTGVTARYVLDVHPDAELVGIDSSEAMLEHARALVPEAQFRVADLVDPLPPGPFDVVTSAFAVHHLQPPAKADLFARVAGVVAPGGRFVLCDVVVPEEPVAAPVPLEDGVDLPSTVADQLAWMHDAGLEPSVLVTRGDLAIIAASPRER
jgi:tRNA (cmo5U34)-methyltransferase